MEPLRGLLERNGVKAEELHAVEVLGGGSRVPALQAALSKALGGRSLDKYSLPPGPPGPPLSCVCVCVCARGHACGGVWAYQSLVGCVLWRLAAACVAGLAAVSHGDA